MSGIARETSALHERVAATVTTQLDGLSERFDRSVATVADTWTEALAYHERTSESLNNKLQDALTAYTETFGQRSSALLSSVDAAHAALRSDLVNTTTGVVRESAALHAKLADSVETQLDGLVTRLGVAVDSGASSWTAALARHERASEHLTAEVHRSLEAFAETFAQRSAALLTTVNDTVAAMQAESAVRDEARQAALCARLDAMAESLQQEWQQAGAQTFGQQEQLCRTLNAAASQIAAEARAQATSTIDEVARLMHVAAQAPQAAAEVIGELRRELSASIARDNELLAERSRIMETSGALLAAINHASTEQRAAIDGLVASSAAMLETAGTRFAERIDAESARMTDVASQIGSGAVEVASLGEAFGLAVQLFSESSDKLMTTLARIEGALDKSMARSDEQLAYYVAQAREIIDLSILSQQQIVEDLQQVSGRRASVAGEA